MSFFGIPDDDASATIGLLKTHFGKNLRARIRRFTNFWRLPADRKFESMRKSSLLNLRSQRSVASPSKFLRRENATRYEGLANPITAKRGEIRVLAAGCSSDDFESSSDRGCAQSDRSAVLEKNFSFPTQANWKLFSGCKFSGEIYSGCRVRKPTG